MLEQPKTLTFTIPDYGQTNSTHELVCYEWGNPNAAQTVLCVHGLTRNGRDFDFLANTLSTHYRVLCPDMPGRGKSQWLVATTGYNTAAYVADITHMLNTLNIKQVYWIGTSMGGIIAMTMVNVNPGLIQTLVLNDVGSMIPAAAVKRIADLADITTTYTNRAAAEKTFRERCAKFGIHDESHWQHLLKHGLQENADGTIHFTYDPNIFASFPKQESYAAIELWPLWEAVTKIPVLLIRGQESDLLTHETAVNMQARHPQLTLKEIDHTGHAPALMETSQMTMIKEWLDALLKNNV